MRSVVLVCAVGFVGLSTGCTTARYVQKNPDSGIVAVADSSNAWPFYNRDKAMDLIAKHVGPDYEIVKEEETVTGQVTHSDQQVNQVPARDPVIPFLSTTQTVVTESQRTEDVKAWFIHYRRKNAPPAPRVTEHTGADGLVRVGIDFNTTPQAKIGGDPNNPPLPSLLPTGG